MVWIVLILLSAVALGIYDVCKKHAVNANAVMPALFLGTAVGTAIVYDNNPDPDRLYTYGVYKGTTEDGKTRYDAYAFDSEMRPVAELKDYLMIPTQI